MPLSEALEGGRPSGTLGWLGAAAGGKQIPPAQRLSGDLEAVTALADYGIKKGLVIKAKTA